MAVSEEVMDKTISSIMTAMIAIVIIVSAFIPTVIGQFDVLGALTSDYVNIPSYIGLLGVVITFVIIGVLYGVIKTYTGNGR